MNHDERHELNEQARIPEEITECNVCGIELTPYELEEPMTIQVPIEGTKYHVEHVVCDKCKSDIMALDFTAYNKASFEVYPFTNVKHI